LGDAIGTEAVLGFRGREEVVKARQGPRRGPVLLLGVLSLVGGPALGECGGKLRAIVLGRERPDIVGGRDRFAAAALAAPQYLLVGHLAPIGVALERMGRLRGQV